MKPSRFFLPIQNLLYLFLLYFKRGAFKTLLYFFTTLIVMLIVGFLLETNAKVSRIVDEVNNLLPSNRIKVTIPKNVKVNNPNIALRNFLGQKTDGKTTRTKDFITPKMLQELKAIKGIEKITPLYTVDFPSGVEFSMPGSAVTFRAEIIGIGLPEKDARKYIYEDKKSFKAEKDEVPVLIASYLLQVFNNILENNDMIFKINEQNVIGFRFKVVVGDSFITGKGNNSGLNASMICRVAGFIDLDYTYGIAFPADIIAKYKKIYWQNFNKNSYDELMLEISISEFEQVEKKIKEKGYIIKEDTQIFKKISQFLTENKKWLSLFLNFISSVILFFGMLIGFYTIIWMLKDRAYEFSLFRFFGSSNLRIVLLYGSYLSLTNLLAVLVSSLVLQNLFAYLGRMAMGFKKALPLGFQSILNESFLLKTLVIPQFINYGFLFLEVSVFTLVILYLISLNRKL